MSPPVVANVERQLFCGICEASCGLVATVAGAEVIAIRPDPAHPNSRGYACPKGVTFAAVRRDPDRVLRPLRRQADGSFQPVSWDEALADIGQRLGRVIAEHGRPSVGLYVGNPVTWNYGAQMALFGMAAALGTKHLYSALSVDINNYLVVSQWLYGNNMTNPIPDLHRTDFLLVLGANPVVSHGSMLTVGHVREALLDITRRGGRVVVIDPRRSETAELFEHLPIRPDADAWLLAAMLKTIFDEGLADVARVAAQATGLDSLRALVASLSMTRAAEETGIAAGIIAQLARDFASAPSAAFYLRCGGSLGQFSTLTKYLGDALNVVTGNLDRPGGVVFGHSMIDNEKLAAMTGQNGYDRWRTRVEGVPEVFGTSPVATLTCEIRTPGKGQLRALVICAGNIVTSVPAGDRIETALGELDLLVSLDPDITETSRLAHYILPPTLWLERDGMPVFTFGHSLVPYAQWTPATVAPAGEARDDGWILDQICRRVGLMPSPVRPMRWLARLGLRISPRMLMDLALRLGPEGDLFGLRRNGLSRSKLWARPGGVKLMDRPATGVLRKRIHHADRRVHLAQPLLRAEMDRLTARPGADPDYPLRVITVRELRSHNTWLQNVPKLMAGGRSQRLRIHPLDAAPLAIESGDFVELTSRNGTVCVVATISDEVMPGTLALPQGWGHRGGWRLAVAAGGANYNLLASSRREEADRLSGQPKLNGIAVRARRASADRSAPSAPARADARRSD
jgi:anaerobic selenocysteine-containing dehydrogenase